MRLLSGVLVLLVGAGCNAITGVEDLQLAPDAAAEPRCGDGTPDENEACDDGNTINEIACPYGTPTCMLCNGDCTSFLILAGNFCGDSDEDPDNETCDDGNQVSEPCDYGTASCPICDGTCHEATGSGNVCGDGDPDAVHEACDDGDQETETACDYGVATCNLCDATCEAELDLLGNVCGDGDPDPEHEDCDDGNDMTEPCDYGVTTCTVCGAGCQDTASTGPYCGDSAVQNGDEACDDSNDSACGTCDATCQTVTSAHATGTVIVLKGIDLLDGETFTIDDGVGTELVFELNKFAIVVAGHVEVAIQDGDGQAAVRNSAIAAINNQVALQVTASAGPGTGEITLTHDRPTSLGNVALEESVGDQDFSVSGMSGGLGGDCPPNTGCNVGDDCESGVCTGGVCE